MQNYFCFYYQVFAYGLLEIYWEHNRNRKEIDCLINSFYSYIVCDYVYTTDFAIEHLHYWETTQLL